VWRLEFFRKVKNILSSHFSEVISTDMIGNDFFVFKYSVNSKNK